MTDIRVTLEEVTRPLARSLYRVVVHGAVYRRRFVGIPFFNRRMELIPMDNEQYVNAAPRGQVQLVGVKTKEGLFSRQDAERVADYTRKNPPLPEVYFGFWAEAFS